MTSLIDGSIKLEAEQRCAACDSTMTAGWWAVPSNKGLTCCPQCAEAANTGESPTPEKKKTVSEILANTLRTMRRAESQVQTVHWDLQEALVELEKLLAEHEGKTEKKAK